jgi:hypothetical protein
VSAHDEQTKAGGMIEAISKTVSQNPAIARHGTEASRMSDLRRASLDALRSVRKAWV